MAAKQKNCTNGCFSLFLSSVAQFGANFHIEFSCLAARAAWFTTGLFCFGYPLDSRANDLRLCLAQESVLEGEAGDSGFKGTLPVARKLRGVGNGLYNSVDAFP
jgi:hypothetical protein